jgi:Protein of unknown function (DUF2939)
MVLFVLCTGWFVISPLLGLSRLADAVATGNPAKLQEKIDLTRVGQSMAPQVVWTYLQKTGRGKVLGRMASSLIAAGSISLADPIVSELLSPASVLTLLNTGRLGNLHIGSTMAPLPNGDIGSLWSAFQDGEYGIGNFHVTLPTSASSSDQYGIHLQLHDWDWKLVGIDLPQTLKDQLADELIRRIGLNEEPSVNTVEYKTDASLRASDY